MADRKQKLRDRGFRDEKHLRDFIDNCESEDIKQELIEYYDLGTDEAEEVVIEKPKAKDDKPKSKNGKNDAPNEAPVVDESDDVDVNDIAGVAVDDATNADETSLADTSDEAK